MHCCLDDCGLAESDVGVVTLQCCLLKRDLIINEPAVLADVIFCTLHCSTAGSGLLTVARFNHLYVVQGTGTFGIGTFQYWYLHCIALPTNQPGAVWCHLQPIPSQDWECSFA